MTFGSLFAGIGGMDLGLERAGMTCKWQVEIDPFCQKVLAKHWPEVKRYGDITKLDGSELERVDLIAGGFPCQDVSSAGLRIGIEGARSGLWSEYSRLVRILRPNYVLIENVTGLLVRGMGRVLADLAEIGFDAEWAVLRASQFGLPHRRERCFIVANSKGYGRVAIHDGVGAQAKQRGSAEECDSQWRCGTSVFVHPLGRSYPGLASLPRVGDGVPYQVERVKGCGNAVVPQVAEWIGRRIIEAANR